MGKPTPQELTARFADLEPAMTGGEAVVEAGRCLFCFDAPCTRACPTQIDVPRFIRNILHGHSIAAARTILDANIFGGSCARACPTEVLCEGACVDHLRSEAPVQIGRLQRFACDEATAAGREFFRPGPTTGRHVAVVGSGPAGLTCAHELRKLGHDVVVFESRDIAGGLNTLGIAAYKISTEFGLSEVALVQQLGVEIRLNSPMDGPGLKRLLDEYDAVFLGIGLGMTASLGIEGEELPGVWEALDFIFQTHRKPFEECEVGQRVVVIGAGNTAIDVATAAVRLGADEVTIAYRRDAASMPAFGYEYELARSDGVGFEWLAQPQRIVAQDGRVGGVEFLRTELSGSDREARVRTVHGSEFQIEADMVIEALGQDPCYDFLRSIPELTVDRGQVVVDPTSLATSIPKLFAGGDCVSGGAEIVDAVEAGKVAAQGIHQSLAG